MKLEVSQVDDLDSAQRLTSVVEPLWDDGDSHQAGRLN
jgi:hypothetical protein